VHRECQRAMCACIVEGAASAQVLGHSVNTRSGTETRIWIGISKQKPSDLFACRWLRAPQ
jgi:hypothetical protein